MKIITMHKLAATISLAFGAMLFPALASAGCGSFDPRLAMHPGPAVAASQDQSAAESGNWHSDGRDPIVGMWKVSLTATDGSGFTDFGYVQWHSDGTEILNSGGRAPATQNFCLGVWERTGESTYKVNHFVFSYDKVTGALVNRINLREEVTAGANGREYSGTFTITLYDPTGTTPEGHIQGNITGTRITVDTPTP